MSTFTTTLKRSKVVSVIINELEQTRTNSKQFLFLKLTKILFEFFTEYQKYL